MNGTKAPSLAMRLDALPVHRWHGYLLTICVLGMLFNIFDAQLIGSVLPRLISEWKLNPGQAGLIASGGMMGMAVGATLFGVIADIIGRLNVFSITLLWCALFSGFCALATGFTSLFIMLFLMGLGLGGMLPVVSAYLAEFVPSRRRGQFMSYFAGAAQVGNSLAFVVGFAIVVPYGWRWAFILGIAPALLVVFVWKTLPESVRYLVQKGRTTEAVKVVENLEQPALGKITVPHRDALEAEKLSESLEGKVRYRDLFKGGLAKTTVMLAVLWICLNYAVFAFAVWAPVLLTRELHYGMASALRFLAIGAFIGILGHVTAGYACDHWGRRPTIACAFIAWALTLYCLFWMGKDPTVGMPLIILVFICLGGAWGSMYVYTSENFPTRVRATGSGFTNTIGRLGGIFGTGLVGIIYAKAGMNWVLHIDTMLLVLAVVVMLVVGRETKRKTLEEISQMQMEGVPTN